MYSFLLGVIDLGSYMLQQTTPWMFIVSHLVQRKRSAFYPSPECLTYSLKEGRKADARHQTRAKVTLECGFFRVSPVVWVFREREMLLSRNPRNENMKSFTFPQAHWGITCHPHCVPRPAHAFPEEGQAGSRPLAWPPERQVWKDTDPM